MAPPVAQHLSAGRAALISASRARNASSNGVLGSVGLGSGRIAGYTEGVNSGPESCSAYRNRQPVGAVREVEFPDNYS